MKISSKKFHHIIINKRETSEKGVKRDVNKVDIKFLFKEIPVNIACDKPVGRLPENRNLVTGQGESGTTTLLINEVNIRVLLQTSRNLLIRAIGNKSLYIVVVQIGKNLHRGG